ncbi:MAG: hypothetical protein AAF366_00155 [Pseudomonadota bacterium]
MSVSMRVGNAEHYIACALAGLGLIQGPACDVRHRVEAGDLVEGLPDHPSGPMAVALVAPDRPSLVPTVAACSGPSEGSAGFAAAVIG